LDEPVRRVSDAEREQTVVSLRDHLLAGRLTLEDFAERVDTAYRARESRELACAFDDLPEEVPSGAEGPRRKPTRVTASLFGHVVRRGRLRLRRWTLALSVFSDVDFDLREAEIENSKTGVNVLAAFGNVDVYVPEGVNVDVTGLTVVGHRNDWGRDDAREDAPTIRVRVFGLVGTVDIWRVPPDMRGRYGEIVKQMREQQRQLPA
jgi:hypothetical protein